MKEHTRFGPVVAPVRPDQLAWLINWLAIRNVNAWRGQAHADWPIQPSLVRLLNTSDPPVRPTEERVRAYERRLMERAESKGFRGSDLGELELLARLRHYGGATRLLDATHNAYVALWFACTTEVESSGVLIGFRLGSHDDTDKLRQSQLKQPIEELLADADGRLQWWHPVELSPRIRAQRALLAFGDTVEEPWGSIVLGTGSVMLPDDPPCGTVPGAAIILISPALKRALNRAWASVFGFDPETLFPDFEGFARANAADGDFPHGFDALVRS